MIPAYFDTTNNQETLVDVVTSLIADAKTAILMQPRKTPFNNPPINPKATAIIGASVSQHRLYALLAKVLGGVVRCRKLYRQAQKLDAEVVCRPCPQ